MNITLIRLRGREDSFDSFAESCEPIGLGYLAASLRQTGHNVAILDELTEGQSREDILTFLINRQPRLVGITVSSQALWTTCAEMATITRQLIPDAHLTVGGHFPSACPIQVLEHCPALSSVVVGEGETTLVDLANALSSDEALDGIQGLVLRTSIHSFGNLPSRQPLDLDALPLMARDTLPALIQKAPVANLITSRGCIGKCDYCSMHAFYGRQGCSPPRHRSAESVNREIDLLVHKYGVRYLQFQDDSFVGPGKDGAYRVHLIARHLMTMPFRVRFSIVCRADTVSMSLFSFLKDAGLNDVFIGAESAKQEFLVRHGKKSLSRNNNHAIKILGELGIHTLLGFVMFEPNSTIEDLEHNLTFLRNLHEYDMEVESYLTRLLPFLGTPFEKQLEKEGRLTGPLWNRSYSFTDPLVTCFETVAVQTVGRWIRFDNENRYRLKWYRHRWRQDNTDSAVVATTNRYRRAIVDVLQTLLEDIRHIDPLLAISTIDRLVEDYSTKAMKSIQPLAARLWLEREASLAGAENSEMTE